VYALNMTIHVSVQPVPHRWMMNMSLLSKIFVSF